MDRLLLPPQPATAPQAPSLLPIPPASVQPHIPRGPPQHPCPEVLGVSPREGEWLAVSNWRFRGAAGTGGKGAAPGGPHGGTAPGPRCSGPESLLGFPTLLPWTLPAVPCTGDGHRRHREGVVTVTVHRHPCPAVGCQSVGEDPGLAAPGGVAPGTSLQCDALGEGQGRPCQGWPSSPRAQALAPKRVVGCARSLRQGRRCRGCLARPGAADPCLCLANTRVLSCSRGHRARSGERRLDQY